MGFTTPCYIRTNTTELRKQLEELGYKCLDSVIINNYGLKTYINPGGFGSYYQTYINHGVIDCETNEDLFLAIAALRDDSDYMQYFVNEVRMGSMNYPESVIPLGVMIKCLVDKWKYPKNDWDSMGIPSHKATLHELIEHFKQLTIMKKKKLYISLPITGFPIDEVKEKPMVIKTYFQK